MQDRDLDSSRFRACLISYVLCEVSNRTGSGSQVNHPSEAEDDNGFCDSLCFLLLLVTPTATSLKQPCRPASDGWANMALPSCERTRSAGIPWVSDGIVHLHADSAGVSQNSSHSHYLLSHEHHLDWPQGVRCKPRLG